MAKILIVEDDPAILELLRLHYTAEGHQVITAEDGYSGTTAANKEKPDLIILDFCIPAANGATVHERMRRSTFTASTPIIFLTAALLPDIMAQIVDDPKTKFLQKPIDFTRLSRMIAEMLDTPPATAS